MYLENFRKIEAVSEQKPPCMGKIKSPYLCGCVILSFISFSEKVSRKTKKYEGEVITRYVVTLMNHPASEKRRRFACGSALFTAS
jgi:hypothetical protein